MYVKTYMEPFMCWLLIRKRLLVAPSTAIGVYDDVAEVTVASWGGGDGLVVNLTSSTVTVVVPVRIMVTGCGTVREVCQSQGDKGNTF